MEKTKTERIIDVIDMVRKLVVGMLAVVLSIILLVFFIRNTAKNRIVIQPFKLSSTLAAKGYTGEMMTALFVQRIREMQDSGRSFYLKNRVVMPSWDDKANEFSEALSESIFGEVKSLLEYFAGTNTQTATGQLSLIDSSLTFIFTLDGLPVKYSGGKDVNVLLGQAAEDALHQIDPFILTGYYYKKGDDVGCLKLSQELLNGSDTTHRGLANHMRGLAYLLRRDTLTAKEAFLTALKTIKSPWITLNNLGVIYDHYDSIETASEMYRRAIGLRPDGYQAYLNFANELYFKRYPGERSGAVLDSCILLYRRAIARNPQESLLYMALLPTLYDKGDTVAAVQCRRKILEMAPGSYVTYFQIAAALKKVHRAQEAAYYFEAAKQHCMGDSLLIKQIDGFSRRD